MSETVKRDVADIFRDRQDEIIVLPTKHELDFAIYIVKESYPGTQLDEYLGRAKTFSDADDLFRQQYGMPAADLAIYLTPAKSALLHRALEVFLDFPHADYPEFVDMAEQLINIYPESYRSRLKRLTTREADEAVNYGNIESQNLDIRSRRLGISRIVLAEIAMGNLKDMSQAEARSFSFNTHQTQMHTMNGAVHGTKIFAKGPIVALLDDYVPAGGHGLDSKGQPITKLSPPEKPVKDKSVRRTIDASQDYRDTNELHTPGELKRYAAEQDKRAEAQKAAQPIYTENTIKYAAGDQSIPQVSVEDDETDVLGFTSFRTPEPRKRWRDHLRRQS